MEVVDKFNRETIDKYLVLCKEKYPEKDVHLLEISIAQYFPPSLCSEATWCEEKVKPDDQYESFINANNKLTESIQQTKKQFNFFYSYLYI